MPFGVSVVIPTYRGADAAAATMQSLAVQTLPSDRYEVLLVVNGPSAGDIVRFEELRRRWADLDVRILSTATEGASLAWNLGVQAARMEWLTFVDDDDSVTTTYLESLLDVAKPGVVPISEIHDRHPDGNIDSGSRLNMLIADAAGTTRSPAQLPQALGFNASKLIPTRWAKAATFDLAMTNGQDVAYFGTIAMDHDFAFAVVARERGAAYLRGLSETSMSRQATSFGFSVEQRLMVIEQLDRARRRTPRNRRGLADHLIAAQTYLINRYLVARPERRAEAVATIRRYGFSSFPYAVFNRDLATRLAVTTEGERAPRHALCHLNALLSLGEPLDIVVISKHSQARSWTKHFWRTAEYPHLEGRVIQAGPPLQCAVASVGEAVGDAPCYREIVPIGRSPLARSLPRALSEARSDLRSP